VRTELAFAVVAVIVLGSPAQLWGQDAAAQKNETAPEKVRASTQELGARLGMEAGGRTTPGGLRLAGTYLYRLTEADWLDQSIAFGFGSRDPSCFRDREDSVLCDHGLLSGFSVDLVVGIRRYLPRSGQFTPYLRGGLALRGVFFTSDDLSGLAIPLWAGAGVRAAVADKLSIFAEATLKTGFGIFGRGLGIEPHASFEFAAGGEFVID